MGESLKLTQKKERAILFLAFMYCYILFIFSLLLLYETFYSTFSFSHSIAQWSCWILIFSYAEGNAMTSSEGWQSWQVNAISYLLQKKTPQGFIHHLNIIHEKNPSLSSLFLIIVMWSLFLTAHKLSRNCVNTKDLNILIAMEIPIFLPAHSYTDLVKK